jgi:hypothetical protein
MPLSTVEKLTDYLEFITNLKHKMRKLSDKVGRDLSFKKRGRPKKG